MTINLYKKVVIASLMFASSAVFAGPLSDYNLMLSGDFNVNGGSGHIEGKSFIGGNVVNGSIYSQYVGSSSTEDTVKVVGNFASNGATHVEGGYLAYQGVFTGPDNICNGTVLGGNTCIKHVTDGSLTTEKASIFAELQAESNYYKSLATSANAVISGDNNNASFVYGGAATDLAVFNITMAQLTNPNWSLDFGSALNVLINVSGDTFNAGTTKVNGFQSNFNHVLWNFSDATQLNFGDSWFGSVLALNADIATGSNLNGAIAAKSYIGNGEIHLGHWDYTPPTKVPEPSSLLLSLFGLGLIALGRLRRQK